MNDIRQDGIKVELDRERKIVFDLNAFCDMEENYGSLENAMEELAKGSMKTIRFMLYIGLKHDDESLTEREVGRLLGINDITNISNKIIESVNMSLPKADESAKN